MLKIDGKLAVTELAYSKGFYLLIKTHCLCKVNNQCREMLEHKSEMRFRASIKYTSLIIISTNLPWIGGHSNRPPLLQGGASALTTRISRKAKVQGTT